MPLAEADGLKPVGVLLGRTVEAACARISPTRFRLSGKPFGALNISSRLAGARSG